MGRQCRIQIRWALKLVSLTTLAMVTFTRRRNFLRRNGRSWAILLSLTSLLVGTVRTFRILTSSSAWASGGLPRVESWFCDASTFAIASIIYVGQARFRCAVFVHSF